MLLIRLPRTALNRVAGIRCAATMALTVVASLAMACQRSPANVIPPPILTSAATLSDTLVVEIAEDAPVRVKVAGDDTGWQQGHWVTTNAGCKGVLTDALFLVRLAALTALELSVPSADGQQWRPVPLTRIRDGDGCANPAGF